MYPMSNQLSQIGASVILKNRNNVHHISCRTVITITVIILQTEKIKTRQNNASVRDQIAAFKLLVHHAELEVGKVVSTSRN